jgi:hypothetical protein
VVLLVGLVPVTLRVLRSDSGRVADQAMAAG